MGHQLPLKRSSNPSLHSSISLPSSPYPSSKTRPLRWIVALSSALRPPRLYRILIAIVLCTTFAFLAQCVPGECRFTSASSVSAIEHFFAFLIHMRRVWRRTLRLYQRQLHLHPLPSRAITAGIIFFVADCSAQLLNGVNKANASFFSVIRLTRYTLYGFFIMGPFLYLWYSLMNEYGPEDDLKGSLLKSVFEQVTLEPICISMYIIYEGVVCRRGLRAVRKKLQAQFFPLWVKNAMFWVPANFANYYIGTPDLRVVFANLCSFFWNVYFSSKVNKFAPSLTSSEGSAKYLPVSSHDLEHDIVSKSTSSLRSSDAASRRTGEVVSSGKSRLLAV